MYAELCANSVPDVVTLATVHSLEKLGVVTSWDQGEHAIPRREQMSGIGSVGNTTFDIEQLFRQIDLTKVRLLIAPIRSSKLTNHYYLLVIAELLSHPAHSY